MNSNKLKAIETYYRGYHFRSRTEARWSVYFDAMSMPFDYEREGFKLPSGWYLPDFWLRELQTWAEVKGQDFSKTEAQLCYELAQLTHHDCLMLHGAPDLRTYAGFWWNSEGRLEHGHALVCGRWELIWQAGAPIQVPANPPNDGLDYFEQAIHTARAARFEHGAVQPYNWSKP